MGAWAIEVMVHPEGLKLFWHQCSLAFGAIRSLLQITFKSLSRLFRPVFQLNTNVLHIL